MVEYSKSWLDNATSEDFLKRLKDLNIDFIITYNQAGNYYGWGGSHPTVDVIVNTRTCDLLQIKRLFNMPIEAYKVLKKGGKVSYSIKWGIVLYQIWTEVGYRRYEDFRYEEYKGYKIISQRDLIDTIKFQLVHTELRAKLALIENAIKNKDIARALFTCISA